MSDKNNMKPNQKPNSSRTHFDHKGNTGNSPKKESVNNNVVGTKPPHPTFPKDE